MRLVPDVPPLSAAEKDALIATLVARVDELTVRVATLEAQRAALQAENTTLRDKLKLPLKTPNNSSTPPSQGHKASGSAKARPKGTVHAGAHRPLHPDPTRRRDIMAERCGHCQADVRGVRQMVVHAYDRIEIPEIVPDVTRVMLQAWFKVSGFMGYTESGQSRANQGIPRCACSPDLNHAQTAWLMISAGKR